MSVDNEAVVSNKEMLRMVSDIVSAYVSFNSLPASDIPDLIRTVHQSLAGIETADEKIKESAPKPAVSVRKSVTPEYIICLEDGKKLKMLKRYLRTKFDMTPEEYRAKWSLPPDYPMVAPNYSTQRSKFAKKIGLGRRRNAA